MPPLATLTGLPDVNKLTVVLNRSKTGENDKPLYQVIKDLIEISKAFQNFTINTINNILPSGVLPVANGGTGNNTFTAGSVIFASGSGGTLKLTEDNANFFWDDTLNRLGVGNNTPGFGVVYEVANKLISVSGDGSASISAHGILELANNRVTAGAGDATGLFSFVSVNNAGNPQTSRIIGFTEGAGGANGFGGSIRFDTKPDNVLALSEKLRLTNTGLLTFQGVAATNPALKRSSTVLQVRLGDDSAYAPLEASILRFNDGTPAIPGLALNTSNSTGWSIPAPGFISLGFSGSIRHLTSGSEYRVGSGVAIGWSSNANPELAGADVALARGGSNRLLMQNAVLFQLVGTTSSFPALKRSGTVVQIRLADDSGNATLETGGLQADSIIDDTGLAANVYTPTLTNVANLDASTSFEAQYLRVGNTVTVSGKVEVDPTLAATITQLGISLPIASNIGAEEDCTGAAFASGIAGQGAAIRGDAANNRAEMVWVSGDVTNQPMYFTFTYQVI